MSTMCEINYTRQAKIIAWIEIVASLVGFIFVSFTTLLLEINPDLRKGALEGDPENFINVILHFSKAGKVTSFIVSTLYFVGEFMLALFLLRSVTQRNYKQIKAWYIITLSICMTALYFFLPGMFFTDEAYSYLLIFIASYAFTAYSVWIIYCLMEELKREGLHMPVLSFEDDKL